MSSLLKRLLLIGALAALVIGALLPWVSTFAEGAALVLAGVCLALWLSEAVPPFVPALLLAVLVPAGLGRHNPAEYGLGQVLGWGADPVLALFFGGFVLSAATRAHALDRALIQQTTRLAGGSGLRLLLLTSVLTAVLSMWLSNIAASALVLASLQPLLQQLPPNAALRRALLLGVAFGADFGGMATPIGSGPNGLALAETAARGVPVSFGAWMLFALPLTLGLLAAALALVVWRFHLGGSNTAVPVTPAEPLPPDARRRHLLAVLLLTVVLWLTEPWHGVAAGVVALGSAAVLFAIRLITPETLRELDWSTLMLIAGGLMLGRLLEQSGVVRTLSAQVNWQQMPPAVGLFGLCIISALLSALMSNTAAVVMLIPLGQAIYPEPSTAILVALAASMGVPFVISTPPNAMAYSQGGLKPADLLVPGLLLMLGGCLLISLTGRAVLHWAGIP
ncbi:SLC13 family permease [Hymenobacter latericus]|uniref:SLC13 family permease n=1 Tax=Hymenobacter sp. YIM 151858-1 TaxID=2987688 RepID=UPI002225FA64|nr:SLC13 family permease [Hymenobacter sp. YIM 151858-1]UYZ57707.1 SLC13 family permease [Hymenobacter sp. YIM 151858-1]